MPGSNPTYAPEFALGAELYRYRRRPEKQVFDDMCGRLGTSRLLWYFAPLCAAFLSFFLSFPVIFLARWMGAREPFLTDPIWGPILIGTWIAYAAMLGI